MALLSGVVFAALCGPAKADWFSDLTDRIQTNSPAAWEGQKRGYYTGGGFGLRLKTSREPLLNIQPPRISAGCGGIDAFWGGFNYLRPEYLVQAFQNIMSAAPAYAFKLALQQLCDPCDDVMSALQQISQAANNLALDECGSAQALVNMGGDAISSMLGMDANQGTSEFGIWVSDKANKLTSGVAKFNDEVRKLQNYAFCEDSPITKITTGARLLWIFPVLSGTKPAKWIEPHRICRMNPFSRWRGPCLAR
ncbi:conjugal transfer protein TraH [Bilophila wadsworthia]